MRCISCAGRGWIRNESLDRVVMPALPCPRCGGTGYDHCCEGSDASCEVILAEPQPAPVVPLSSSRFESKPAA
jgi:hypothetical protein